MKTFFLAFMLAQTASGADDKTYDQLRVLVDVFNDIQSNYVDEPDAQKLVYGAAAGMMRTLDPFSQFMDPEVAKELKTETEGEYGGLGIRIEIRDNALIVSTPLPGSPAYRAGILPEDRIVEIDGETTKDISQADALKKLRGEAGKSVRLRILRQPEGADDKPWTSHDFILVREKVRLESVQPRMLEDKVGYARITEFNARTPDDFSKALRDLSKEGMTSLVLDLRNNPGGLLASAVDVASAFLDGRKLIVYTQGRKIDKPQEYHSGAKAAQSQLPLVVLINEGSASGAEIVAGALQDHRRAVIMGMRSYGKASVQSVIPLPDGAGLRLTVARYYTPSGRSIHRDEKNKTGGIVPDIAVKIPQEVESKLYTQWEMIYAKNRKPKSIVRKEDMIPDETLDRAQEILKARDVLSRLKPSDG